MTSWSISPYDEFLTTRDACLPDLATNILCYGDNLDILRRYLPNASD